MNTCNPLPIVFQHIPKTAGVSLRAVIGANFHVNRIAHVPDRYWCDAAYVNDAASRHDFVHGHLHYTALAGLVGAARVVTFLRNPIERVRSLYFFLRSQSPDGFAMSDPRRFFVEQARSLPLHEFADHPDASIASMVSDYQIRTLTTAADEASNNWLERALDNLKDYHFVGIADSDLLNHCVIELCRLNGWATHGDVPLANHVTRDASADSDLAAKIIAARNPRDIALYRLIRQPFVRAAAARGSKLTSSTAAKSPSRSYTTGIDGDVKMDQPLRCWGWHDRETDGLGNYWRCGAARDLGLQLRLPLNRSLFVLFHLVSVHPRVAMARVTAESRGQRLRSISLHYNDRWHIGVWVSSRRVDADGVLTMQLHCPVMNEGEYEPPLVADSRFVTIVLERIHITAPGHAVPPMVEEFLRRRGSWLTRLRRLLRDRIALVSRRSETGT